MQTEAEAQSQHSRTAASHERAADLREPQLFSLCEVYPRTGRTHQIRAHFAGSGYPLVGDIKYGGPPLSECAINGCSDTAGRLFLHAARLRFTTADWDGSADQRVHEVSAPLPRVLSTVLEGMTKIDGNGSAKSQ